MTLPRVVGAEVLDELDPADPAAQRSRRDLRRVHRAMGTRAIVRRALAPWLGARADGAPLRVLELGAGDGSLMLGVARTLGAGGPPVELTLLDRQPLVDRATLDGYAAVGWRATMRVGDALDWAAAALAAAPAGTARAPIVAAAAPGRHASGRWDLVVANLFLHHFDGAPLAALLAAIAARADRFLACEPRRGRLALAGSHLVGAIGANAVTRTDAVLSVHAGFRDRELTALWPQPGAWRLDEHAAGLFSHCLRAERIAAAR